MQHEYHGVEQLGRNVSTSLWKPSEQPSVRWCHWAYRHHQNPKAFKVTFLCVPVTLKVSVRDSAEY